MAAVYIRREGNHLYEYSLYKTRTAGINGSRLSMRQDRFNDDVGCFGASCNLQQWLERARKRNDWLWSGKSPYFTLPYLFQINSSVKISARLLRNFCGNFDEKFVSGQSSGLLRDIPAMDEVELRRNFRLSRAAGHFPANAARVSWP